MIAIESVQIFLFIVLIITAYLSIHFKDLLAAAVTLGAFSLVMSLEYFILHAPDVAIAEAAIGAGLTTAIFIFAVKATKREDDC